MTQLVPRIRPPKVAENDKELFKDFVTFTPETFLSECDTHVPAFKNVSKRRLKISF